MEIHSNIQINFLYDTPCLQCPPSCQCGRRRGVAIWRVNFARFQGLVISPLTWSYLVLRFHRVITSIRQLPLRNSYYKSDNTTVCPQIHTNVCLRKQTWVNNAGTDSVQLWQCGILIRFIEIRPIFNNFNGGESSISGDRTTRHKYVYILFCVGWQCHVGVGTGMSD